MALTGSLEVDLFAPEFTGPDKARDVLEAERWPDGPVCTHCGLGAAYKLEPRPGAKTHARKGVWKCAGCRKQFTVTIGTIFEDSHIPLNKWLLAIDLMCASEQAISARQLQGMLGIGYRAACFLAHRIRYGMKQEPLASKVERRDMSRLSLHPLQFREAIRDLLQVKPEKKPPQQTDLLEGKPTGSGANSGEPTADALTGREEQNSQPDG